jgi:hypothetical protein
MFYFGLLNKELVTVTVTACDRVTARVDSVTVAVRHAVTVTVE